MHTGLLLFLILGCAVLFVIEVLGVPTTLSLHFKDNLKRESRWLAQYGQSVCTPVAVLLVWRLDPRVGLKPIVILVAVIVTSLNCTIIKRLLGRVRPGRENAGRFLGPTLGHANFRESFPSSHSGCAVALSTVLTAMYPQAAAVFWTLAVTCAALRYLLDAHWPSDVLGGCAMGYGVAWVVMDLMKM